MASKINITSLNVTVDLIIVGELRDFSDMIVTKISTKDDLITDYIFSNVKLSSDENGNLCLKSKDNYKVAGVFEVVSFVNNKCESFYEVIKHYDWPIVAFNEEKYFKMNRNELPESFPDIYVITAN